MSKRSVGNKGIQKALKLSKEYSSKHPEVICLTWVIVKINGDKKDWGIPETIEHLSNGYNIKDSNLLGYFSGALLSDSHTNYEILLSHVFGDISVVFALAKHLFGFDDDWTKNEWVILHAESEIETINAESILVDFDLEY